MAQPAELLEPAVDHQVGAGDVTAAIGDGQELHGFGYVIWLAQPAHRHRRRRLPASRSAVRRGVA
jgi:hypothetical protein